MIAAAVLITRGSYYLYYHTMFMYDNQ